MVGADADQLLWCEEYCDILLRALWELPLFRPEAVEPGLMTSCWPPESGVRNPFCLAPGDELAVAR